jgi:hypothetical protein
MIGRRCYAAWRGREHPCPLFIARSGDCHSPYSPIY